MLGGLRSVCTATRRATVAAPVDAVWGVVCDPHHQPRWWPGVERVEGVRDRGFTQVLRTRRGRPVRVDFVVAELDAPRRAAWRQQLAGTPFARVLHESVIELELEPRGERTAVTITHRQRLRGASRTGALMLRRATGRRLDEALEGLGRIL
jgi:uncharacterized protein YndB with AHSA1/START domain